MLKLIGTRNSTISWMILQESFAWGWWVSLSAKTVATLCNCFPKYVRYLLPDAVLGLLVIVVVCTLASVMAHSRRVES